MRSGSGVNLVGRDDKAVEAGLFSNPIEFDAIEIATLFDGLGGKHSGDCAREVQVVCRVRWWTFGTPGVSDVVFTQSPLPARPRRNGPRRLSPARREIYCRMPGTSTRGAKQWPAVSAP